MIEENLGGSSQEPASADAVRGTSAHPASDGLIEEVAVVLWHRFAPDYSIEWEDESEKAIYRDAAQQALAAISKAEGR